ncbi:L-serine dehydratase [Bradyrhizobium sp. F1.4.3]|uniref:L-serine ammonia-lyase n=1 Tax=Bradyrhizobium sp. F1.4.3 TaxID=3156356 RepID=UPI0033918263
MISVFDVFKIGIGPSSSHTVGPMKGAASFVAGDLSEVARIEVTLYGSLAWTGVGHATDRAIILGLSGERPDTVNPDHAQALLARVGGERRLVLDGRKAIAFEAARDLQFDKQTRPPRHPNTLRFAAYGDSGECLREERWCSVGGGFVIPENELGAAQPANGATPFSFSNARELLILGERHGLPIAAMIRENEATSRPADEVRDHLRLVARTMFACIDRGLSTSGELPGGLKVKRRASAIYQRLKSERLVNDRSAHEVMDFLSVFAIAVNEENAAGGQVVTAPTNGAAGVVQAVLRYYRDFCAGTSEEGIETFLLTATAIGALFKMNASISGAEVGCQGEVGVASSMAAAGLAAALGGSNTQIENAAEIAMEHHLGMTCDPINGLVQIPCIERNAFGAVKAVNAASLALHGDGAHKVSLDQVVATMRQTGADMQDKYKETSLGGLAVSWVEC